jgi:hypothetical protein
LSLLIAGGVGASGEFFYYTEDDQSAFFPASWTDAGKADPFVALSRGRAFARFEGLLRLVDSSIRSCN